MAASENNHFLRTYFLRTYYCEIMLKRNKYLWIFFYVNVSAKRYKHIKLALNYSILVIEIYFLFTSVE